MALVIYFGLLPLVYFIPPVISKFIDTRIYVVAISLALIVPTMVYFVLPIANKLLLKTTAKKS